MCNGRLTGSTCIYTASSSTKQAAELGIDCNISEVLGKGCTGHLTYIFRHLTFIMTAFDTKKHRAASTILSAPSWYRSGTRLAHVTFLVMAKGFGEFFYWFSFHGLGIKFVAQQTGLIKCI